MSTKFTYSYIYVISYFHSQPGFQGSQGKVQNFKFKTKCVTHAFLGGGGTQSFSIHPQRRPFKKQDSVFTQL